MSFVEEKLRDLAARLNNEHQNEARHQASWERNPKRETKSANKTNMQN
jgi:hypothetical protein